MFHYAMFETVGSCFERFDCGIRIDGMDGSLEPVPVRFIDDRSQNRLLQLQNLDIESQCFELEEIW